MNGWPFLKRKKERKNERKEIRGRNVFKDR
jgi:hypothetical protein